MLVIISGIETVNKRFFSKQVIAGLNTFTKDGYRIDFTKLAYEIYDETNKLVYRPAHENSSLPGVDLLVSGNEDTEVRADIAEYADRIKSEIDLSISSNHYANEFCDPWYDYGLVNVINAPIDGVVPTFGPLPHRPYESIVENYKNRPMPVQVITGSFSKYFITKISNDLGINNVKVINITRNPSVAFLLNELPPGAYTSTQEKPRDRSMDRRKVEKSIVSANIIKDIPGVVTYKYEDLLRTGTFEVNGVQCVIPEQLKDNTGLITKWELTEHIPLNVVSKNELFQFNDKFSNYEPGRMDFIPGGNGHDMQHTRIVDILDKLNADNGTNITKADVAVVPSNLFNELGYTPYSYSEIIKPSQG